MRPSTMIGDKTSPMEKIAQDGKGLHEVGNDR
jgi:hypothetical protein